MFTFAQFDYLHSLWNGKFDNAGEICSRMCGGVCCHSEKFLFPGEVDYLYEKSGVRDSNWYLKDECICSKVGVKSIICKLYPLKIRVTHNTVEVIQDSVCDGYSNMCKKLSFENTFTDINNFAGFLLSDWDNRLALFNVFQVHEEVPMIRKQFSSHGFKISYEEARLRSMHNFLGIGYDDRDAICKNVFNREPK